jgi:hypothetical protein
MKNGKKKKKLKKKSGGEDELQSNSSGSTKSDRKARNYLLAGRIPTDGE